MAGFTSDPFTTIPDAALEADARQSAADDWASKQRANVAQMWADNARAEAQQLFGGLGSLVGQAGEAIGGAAGQVGQAAGNALGAVSQASDVLTAKPLREGIVGGIGDIVRSAPAAQLVAPPTGEEQAQQVQTSPGASLIAGTLNRYVPAENQQQQEEINRLALAGGGLAMGMSG
nr:hypothetical protein [Dehalococcoidales bacterium]